MFCYEKKLQYPVRISTPNPKLASVIISQYGGPDGELGASLRYLSQRFSMPYPELQGLLTDIGSSGSYWARVRSDGTSRKVQVRGSRFSLSSTRPSRCTTIRSRTFL